MSEYEGRGRPPLGRLAKTTVVSFATTAEGKGYIKEAVKQEHTTESVWLRGAVVLRLNLPEVLELSEDMGAICWALDEEYMAANPEVKKVVDYCRYCLTAKAIFASEGHSLDQARQGVDTLLEIIARPPADEGQDTAVP